MSNPFLYPPGILYPFLTENKYFEYKLNLTPSQIKKFGENNIITLDFRSYIKPFKVFLTKTQIEKLKDAKKLKKKVGLQLSKTQFKKTLAYIIKINHSLLTQKTKDRLDTLKKENSNKKREKNDNDEIIKNTLKKYNKHKNQLENLKKEKPKKEKSKKPKKEKSKKPKPKKKSIWDEIKFPKPLTL